MNKKGFTLVELLTVVVIIGLVIGIAVFSISNFLGRGRAEYYYSVENNVLVATQDYLLDYRSLYPRNIGDSVDITLKEILATRYIENVKDSNGNNCTEGMVRVTRTGRNTYDYKVCLLSCGNYTSEVCENLGDGSLQNQTSVNFAIEVDRSKVVVEQCTKVTIPRATVRDLRSNEVITTTLESTPKVIDETRLGIQRVNWVYRNANDNVVALKEYEIVDRTKPTKPTITMRYVGGAVYNGEITNQNIVLTVKSIDFACPSVYPTLKGSGIKEVRYRTTPTSPWVVTPATGETTNVTIDSSLRGTIQLITVDYAGNESDISTFNIYVDKTNPVAPTLTGGNTTSSWRNNTVTITINNPGTDNFDMAGYDFLVTSSATAPNASTIPTGRVGGIGSGTLIHSTNAEQNGTYVYARSVDAAGNVSSWSTANRIYIDNTPPTCVSSVGSATWFNTSRTITGTCSDTGGSGCSGNISFTYDNSVNRNITNGGPGPNGTAGVVTDNAGNTGNCQANQQVRIDITPPTLSFSTTRTTNSITVTANGTDSESGVRGYQFSKDNGTTWTTEQTSNIHTFSNLTSGTYNIRVRAINNVNLTTTADPQIVTLVDLDTPTYTITPSSGWSASKTVLITYNGTGTYLFRPTVAVTTNVAATTCSSVSNGAFTCNGTVVNANGTLTANTWYRVTSNPTLTFTSNGDIIAQVSDGINFKASSVQNVSQIDNTCIATVTIGARTTNSIVVTGGGTDGGSGRNYQYSRDGGATWLPTTPQTGTSYTFSGLTANTSYNMRVRVTTGAGRTCDSTTTAASTQPMPTITFSAPGTGWTQSKTTTVAFNTDNVTNPVRYIRTTVATTSNLASIQSCGTGSTPGTCTTIASTTNFAANTWYIVVGNPTLTFTSNGSAIAQLSDGNQFNTAVTQTVTNIDTIIPVCAISDSVPTTVVLGASQPVSATAITIGASGVASTNCTPTNTSSLADGTHTLSCTITSNSGITSNPCTRQVTIIIHVDQTFSFTGDAQTFTVPVTGNYEIQLWGAQGGSSAGTGGRGGYTRGTINLTQGESISVYVGGQANVFNGGGPCGSNCTRGGGATDIRLVGGPWDNIASLRMRIMVAAGGGGSSTWTGHNANGGFGGGLTGGSGERGGPGAGSSTAATGGTQNSGGIRSSSNGHPGFNGLFGIGGGSTGIDSNWVPAGGGGYYGGGSGGGTTSHEGWVNAGAGGSSFISGRSGCNAINMSGIHTGQPNHFSGRIFTDTQMTAGNALMPNTTGIGTQIGHGGNGFARIRFITP